MNTLELIEEKKGKGLDYYVSMTAYLSWQNPLEINVKETHSVFDYRLIL